MQGAYPAIFEHPEHGKAARDLFDDAQKLLDEIEKSGALTARGAIGFWPANACGDDITLYTDASRASEQRTVLHSLRQQATRKDGRAGARTGRFRGTARQRYRRLCGRRSR